MIRLNNTFISNSLRQTREQIRRQVRDERTPEILALAQLHPHESLKRVEQESGVRRSTIWRISS